MREARLMMKWAETCPDAETAGRLLLLMRSMGGLRVLERALDKAD